MSGYKTALVSLLLLFSAKQTLLSSAEVAPYSLNVYSFGDIGSAERPYGSDFQGVSAALGSVYFKGFSANDQGKEDPYAVYTGKDFTMYSGAVNNGGIEARGSVYANALSVQGNIHGGGNLAPAPGSEGYGTVNGNVIISGKDTSNLSISGKTITGKDFNPSLNLGGVGSYFLNASTYWAGLEATANYKSVDSGNLLVSELKSGRNVVSLSLADLQKAYAITLIGPKDAFVIFNLADAGGKDVSLKDVTFKLEGGITADSILYNALNPDQLSLSGGQYLSILAPNATLEFSSGLLTGNLIAANLYGSGQVNKGVFVGFEADQRNFLAVPEPRTYILLGCLVSIVLLLGSYRNRNRET